MYIFNSISVRVHQDEFITLSFCNNIHKRKTISNLILFIKLIPSISIVKKIKANTKSLCWLKMLFYIFIYSSRNILIMISSE